MRQQRGAVHHPRLVGGVVGVVGQTVQPGDIAEFAEL